MKKLMALMILIGALVMAPVAKADKVRTCSSVYGGGEVCGESTTDVVVEHKVVAAGISDLEMWQVMAILGGVGAVATVFYKLSYRWYLFD
ncbi:MAG: hypothetical protein ABII80_01330 [bacterium]